MEVHTHSHTDPAHGGPRTSGRKKFTHYLWEFLMLFLAVFCGFLAEYQLEHKIEKDKEMQYIKSLARDVSDDIKFINDHYKGWQNNYNTADSLAKLIAGTEIIKKSGIAINLIPDAIGFSDFVSNDGTIRQLMNSGGLRLIHKADVVDSIMAYQKRIELMKSFQDVMNQHQLNSQRLTDIFDFVAYRNSNNKKEIPLLLADKKSLNTAYTYIMTWRKNFFWLLFNADRVKQLGEGLLRVIHKQYRIN
jgi:hypothetical protein